MNHGCLCEEEWHIADRWDHIFGFYGMDTYDNV